MPTLMKKPNTLDDSPAVQQAWEAWKKAKTKVDDATARVKHLKLVLHPDYGLATDEIEQLEAEAALSPALKNLSAAMRDEKEAKHTYETVRHAEMVKLGHPLRDKLRTAINRRDHAMEAVSDANDEVLAIYAEACQLLGQSQKIIPNDLGLPWLNPTNGNESWWHHLQQYYSREAQS